MGHPECKLTPPFAPAAPYRHGDCVWLQDEGGWRYAPANVPGAAGDIALWSGQYDGRRGNYRGNEWSGFQRDVYDQGYEEGQREGCPKMNPEEASVSASYPSGQMVLAELATIADMAKSILPKIEGRPAPWVEFKLARAAQSLRDVTTYAAYGRKTNPEPAGYMARRSLAQIVDDATWLQGVITPDMDLSEWATHYVYEVQADVEDVYVYMVRGSSKAANPFEDPSIQQGLTLLGYPATTVGLQQFQQDYNAVTKVGLFGGGKDLLPENGQPTEATRVALLSIMDTSQIKDAPPHQKAFYWEYATGQAWRTLCRPNLGGQGGGIRPGRGGPRRPGRGRGSRRNRVAKTPVMVARLRNLLA